MLIDSGGFGLRAGTANLGLGRGNYDRRTPRFLRAARNDRVSGFGRQRGLLREQREHDEAARGDGGHARTHERRETPST